MTLFEKEYQTGFIRYEKSYNSNDTTDALLQMIEALNCEIGKLKAEIRILKQGKNESN